MTPSDKFSLLRSLKDAQAHISDLFEALATDTEPKALVYDANALHDRAAEVLVAVVGLCRAPTELPFVGANVEIPPERTPAEDKAAQRVIGLEKLEAERGWTEQRRWDSDRLEAARGEAGLTALLDDTEPVFSAERDNRRSA